LTAQVERLSAEAEGRPFKLSDEVIAKAPQVAEDERALYDQRQRRLASEQRTLTEQLRQKTQELAEFRSKQGQYSSSLALLQQEMNMSSPLVGTGAVSPVEILRLKRSAVEIRGSLNATTLAIPGPNRRSTRSRARSTNRNRPSAPTRPKTSIRNAPTCRKSPPRASPSTTASAAPP
jgi:hypothetical protein